MNEQHQARGPSLFRFFLYELPKRQTAMLATLLSWRREFGEVIRLPLRNPPTLQLGNPEDIRHVLVTNSRNYRKTGWLVIGKEFLGDGLLTSTEPLHSHQRDIVKPAFHRQTVLSYADQIVQAAHDCTAIWIPGSIVNVSHRMARLTLVNIGKAFLNVDLSDVADDLIASFTVCQQYMTRTTSFMPNLIPTPLRLRYLRVVAQIDKVVYGIIRAHRANPPALENILSILLSARTENNNPLSEHLIRDEIVTMLWAGHETTYNALEWAWYEISRHPRVESRLIAELEGHPPNGANVQDLKYTEMVLAETLRLYPPAWILGRWALNDDTLDSGIRIPRGSQVFVIPYVVHRDPRFFPDPERFDPERFSPESKAGRSPFSYFPFGAGQRACIGEHFGKMEGILTLATIAQQCKLTLVPGQHVTPKPLLTLRPKHGIMMRVTRRS